MAPVGQANGQRQQAGGEAGPQAPWTGGLSAPVTPQAESRLLGAAWPRAVGMRGHGADQEEGGEDGSVTGGVAVPVFGWRPLSPPGVPGPPAACTESTQSKGVPEAPGPGAVPGRQHPALAALEATAMAGQDAWPGNSLGRVSGS